jgi:hypothetical protein
MSFLKNLLRRGQAGPKPRVRVCIECGMPLAQHKDWCAIRQTELEMEQKRAEAAAPGRLGVEPTPNS